MAARRSSSSGCPRARHAIDPLDVGHKAGGGRRICEFASADAPPYSVTSCRTTLIAAIRATRCRHASGSRLGRLLGGPPRAGCRDAGVPPLVPCDQRAQPPGGNDARGGCAGARAEAALLAYRASEARCAALSSPTSEVAASTRAPLPNVHQMCHSASARPSGREARDGQRSPQWGTAARCRAADETLSVSRRPLPRPVQATPVVNRRDAALQLVTQVRR
jgi:hypothetical protein